MPFHFEQLGPERFQEFAQALIISEQPNVQAIPVAQPDGGVDARQYRFISNEQTQLVAFQIKYVRNPQQIDDPHKWLEEQLRKEAPKIAKQLARLPVIAYFLVTNVPGTAHPEVGSIDKVQQTLDESFTIPAMAWWRSDLDRRVEVAPKSLRWSYPEIMRGTDVLELLIDSDLGENRRRRADAIRAFVAEQFEQDADVKFKQVELQDDLISLFVDVPAVISKGPGDRRTRSEDQFQIMKLSSLEDPDSVQQGHFYFDNYRQPVGAAALLLSDVGQRRFPFCVLEGAPGQGKSTLAQFISQVYRIGLRAHPDLDGVQPYHRPSCARIPVKVDLTEFASWNSGQDPFAATDGDPPHRTGPRSLESFVAAQIEALSGGLHFGVDDLHAVMRDSHLLLVLDSLDEVAETKTRDSVIREINSTARRFRDLAPDIQIVVTTRPSAYVGVSDFSSRIFHHLHLTNLTTKLISDYARRWTTARRIDARDAAVIRRSLQARLKQSHVRDLATNPMQLAILLSVIHSRGSSLPDKRTALYDIYVELFLAREAEKTREVREHSDLLVDVHQYLAYVLHARAESGGNLGRVAHDALMEILRTYLESEGRDAALANEIFEGAQRVVFLVSRVEGTFEFEVQPLREYFAGKYLYETAAYSPVGNERRGTMPDRFDALSRNPYWLNVTRFFAGSLSKGELPALVDRLQSLVDDPDYRNISHPRYLAATLLSDWVFTQHHRSLRAVVDIVLDATGVRSLARLGSAARHSPLTLPSGAGRSELIEVAFDALSEHSTPSSSFHSISELLVANTSRTELLESWDRRYAAAATASDRRKWFAAAYFLGLYSEIGADRIAAIALESDPLKTASYLLRSRSFDAIVKSDELFSNVMTYAVDQGVLPTTSSARMSVLDQAFFPVSVNWWRFCVSPYYGQSVTVADVFHRQKAHREVIDTMELQLPDTGAGRAVAELAGLAEELQDTAIHEWQQSISHWSKAVEIVRREWGTYRIGVIHAAMAASLAKDPLDDKSRLVSLLDESEDLCLRLRAARLRAGQASWWKQQLESATTHEEVQLAVAALLFASGPKALTSLAGVVDSAVRQLNPEQVRRIARLQLPPEIEDAPHQRARRRCVIDDLPVSLSPETATLYARAMPHGIRVELDSKYLADYSGENGMICTFRTQLAARAVVLAGESASMEQWSDLVVRATAKDSGESALYELPQAQHRLVMPLPVAQEVAKRGDGPDVILALAERACEASTFEKCRPLGAIATEEEWFSSL